LITDELKILKEIPNRFQVVAVKLMGQGVADGGRVCAVAGGVKAELTMDLRSRRDAHSRLALVRFGRRETDKDLASS
jgi:hypothetical protein